MPINGQVIRFDESEPKGRDLVHQSLMTEVSSVVYNWTRKQKQFATVFLGNFLQKHSPLLQGQIVNAFDGRDDIVTLE